MNFQKKNIRNVACLLIIALSIFSFDSITMDHVKQGIAKTAYAQTMTQWTNIVPTLELHTVQGYEQLQELSTNVETVLPQNIDQTLLKEAVDTVQKKLRKWEEQFPVAVTVAVQTHTAMSITRLLDFLARHYDRVENVEANEWKATVSMVDAIMEKIGWQHRWAKQVEDALLYFVETVIQQSSRVVLNGVTQDAVVRSQVTKRLTTIIGEKMKTLIESVNQARNELAKRSTIRALLSVVSFDVRDANAVAFEMEIPSETLQLLATEKVDAFEWNTSFGSVMIVPQVGRLLPDAQHQLTIRWERFMWDAERYRLLSNQQKAVIDEGDVGYQIRLFATSPDGQRTLLERLEDTFIVRILYPLKAEENRDMLTVLNMNSDGTVVNKVGRFDQRTSEMYFFADTMDPFLIQSLNPLFKDVATSYWASSYISSMAAKGIVQGKPKGKFDPKGSVTRAELAKMIALYTGIYTENAYTPKMFVDVPERAWYFPYVVAATSAELINGYPDGRFRPKNFVTREEMAVILARILNLKSPKNFNDFLPFSDREKISRFARGAVAATVLFGLLEGKTKKMFKPKDAVTRAEATTMMYRMSQY